MAKISFLENQENLFDVLIIGGGLAGLSAAIHLQQHGFKVIIFEKNAYPKHKVCGEYISNEVLPYFNFLGIDVFDLGAERISKFQISNIKGEVLSAELPLGGFGISRFALDNALSLKAQKLGALIIQDTVISVEFLNEEFTVATKESGTYKAAVTIGAFGKRTNLDVKLNRDFIKNKSPYLAVKTHVVGNFPKDVVALHNFEGGYCGVSKVENDRINVCYITNLEAFKKYNDIEDFQKQVLYKNRHLKTIFENSTPLFEAPLTISQISFDRKAPVEQHMLMCGDSAGMIHPLCGNGMSMAIRSAQIASTLIIEYLDQKISRSSLETSYAKSWNHAFKNRLKVGHIVAKLFNSPVLAEISLMAIRKLPFLMPFIIKQTHGKLMTVK